VRSDRGQARNFLRQVRSVLTHARSFVAHVTSLVIPGKIAAVQPNSGALPLLYDQEPPGLCQALQRAIGVRGTTLLMLSRIRNAHWRLGPTPLRSRRASQRH